MKPTTHPSPFAGCRTEAEIRAQIDALNRLYVGVQRIADANANTPDVIWSPRPIPQRYSREQLLAAFQLPKWTMAPTDCRLRGR